MATPNQRIFFLVGTWLLLDQTNFTSSPPTIGCFTSLLTPSRKPSDREPLPVKVYQNADISK